MTFSHIFTIVVPVFLVIALIRGRRRTSFGGGARTRSGCSLWFALPASLFLGIATPRATSC